MRMRAGLVAVVLALAGVVGVGVWWRWHRGVGERAGERAGEVGWRVYGGDARGDHYSTLGQINRGNVKGLRAVWSWDTGETGGMQTQPLVVGERMFVATPSQKVVALEAATGKELWRFDSGIVSNQPDRGFSYWTDGRADGRAGRLFAQTLYGVWALDPATGRPIQDFGKGGMIDLREGLGAESPAGTVAVTAPGAIYKDLLILGFRTGEATPSPHGDIRAYDVRTGKLRWSFHTIPHPGEPGYETWPKEAWRYTGAANNWAGMAVDAERGIVYAPTGSAATDFYGADRAGDDLYANTLLALDAATGRRLWHFQAVHHDIWDRDFSSPPVLLTVNRDGRRVDAVAQTTKQGVVYLFDRATGKPLFPIEERPYPKSDVPGEWTSPTQPMPLAPVPFARQRLTAEMLTTRTPEAHAEALRRFRTFRSEGQFVPLGVDRETVVFPGFDGGAEWGGPAVDPTTGVLYVNANEMAWTGSLTEVKAGVGPGATLYGRQCVMCHGADRAGQAGVFPSLVEASAKQTDAEMALVIHNGRGRMPSYPNFSADELAALLRYLRTGTDGPPMAPSAHGSGPAMPAPAPPRNDKDELPGSGASTAPAARYRFTGYHKFLDGDGYPAVAPPWGTLSAIDLNTGAMLWQKPLGEYPELLAKGMGETGSENYGGPVVTAGGLVLIGATNFDGKMRAFDSRTGELVWEAQMDFAGNATPATYMVGGRQFVVIATSNARNPKGRQGAKYVAFALGK